MNANYRTDRLRASRAPQALRAPLAAVAIVAALALLTVGARQATMQLDDGRGGQLSAAPVAAVAGPGDDSSDAALDAPDAPETAGKGSGSATGTTWPDDRSHPPSEPGAAVHSTMTVGPVVADGEYEFVPVPDQLVVEPGMAAARTANPQLPELGGTGPGPAGGNPGGSGSSGGGGSPGGSGGSGGPGGISGNPDGTLSDQADGAPADFTLGAHVATTGHHARIKIGVGAKLDGGLAALSVDFGDGSDPFQLDEERVASIRNGGRVEVRHTYPPTLTPQPQAAVVTAVDSAGQVHERSLRFDTRAAYRLSYSPLTVKALDKCDTVGKGDFEVTWQNDAGLPAGKTSAFKLGKDEFRHVREFRTTVEPVHFQELPVLFEVDGEPEFFYLRVKENDPWGARFFAVWRWDLPSFAGSSAVPRFLQDGPVAQLGSHQYQVTLTAGDVESGGGDDCSVRLAFTVYLDML